MGVACPCIQRHTKNFQTEEPTDEAEGEEAEDVEGIDDEEDDDQDEPPNRLQMSGHDGLGADLMGIYDLCPGRGFNGRPKCVCQQNFQQTEWRFVCCLPLMPRSLLFAVLASCFVTPACGSPVMGFTCAR